MQRMVRSIFIALIGFSMVSTAHPAVTASKEKLIRELLALTHADTTPDAVLDILGGRLGLPPLTGAQGKANQIEIYDRYFAEQDLRELIDFFKTSAGQRFAAVAPKIAAEARKNLKASTGRYIAETKQRDQAHKTRNEFRGAGFALKAYYADHKSYPDARIEAVPAQDAWGRAVEYRISEDRQHFRIVSAGADGKLARGTDLKRSDDIVFTDTGFIQGDDPTSSENSEAKRYASKKKNLAADLLRAMEGQDNTADAVLDIIGSRLGLGIAPEDARGEVRESPQMAEIAEETQLALYERYFSEGQLKRMIAFFKSEPGEHYVKAARKIAAETRKNARRQ